MMTILIASRTRGASTFSHLFRVEPWQWADFREHVEAWRNRIEYYQVVDGDYVPVLG